jgi:hypothetical protein
MIDESVQRAVDSIPDAELDSTLQKLSALAVQTPADYIPHQKQLLFHCSEKKIRFMCGGNQSGKTEGGVAEDMMHATGIYPDWYPMSQRLKMANKGRIIVTNYGAGAAVLEEKIWHWLPKNLAIDIDRTQQGAIRKMMIRHRTGGVSQIEIMTHEQDDDAFESWTGHWAHFDEPAPREKFIATQRGLIALGGRCWLTLTPITEPWLFDEFIGNERDDVFFITVDIRDNPHLSEQHIAEFEANLTEDEKESRLHGRFRHLTGLVYKMFDPNIHVLPGAKIQIDPRWPTYFITDPHDRKPFFSLWGKVDPFGNLYIIAEIKTKQSCTIKEFAREVFLREATMEPMIRSASVIRILDPNKGNTPSASSGLTMKNELADCGLYYTADVNDDIAAGHIAVAGKLSWDKRFPISTTNKPKLYFIKETTKECVRYMQRYVWSDWRGATKDEKGKKEKPMENFKDFPDCVRYFVMSNPCYFENDEGDPTPQGGGYTGYGPGE